MERKALIQAANHIHSENEAIAAGRKAELQVGDYLLSTLQGPLRQVQIWHDIRIPRPDDSGRYEIDFLLASPYGILVLEVKNFGGSLSVEAGSGRWLQTTSTQQRKVHEDPLALTAKKLEALRRYLESQGLSCRPQSLQLRVVQANPRLVMSRELASKSQICRLEDLADSYYTLLPTKAGLLGIGRSPKAFPRMGALVKALNALPSWDEIELHGGKILRGDLYRSYGSILPSREDTQFIRLLVPRHPIWGRLHPCLALYTRRLGGFLPLPWIRILRGQERLRFQAAGSADSTEIPSYSVRAIRFGSAGKQRPTR